MKKFLFIIIAILATWSCEKEDEQGLYLHYFEVATLEGCDDAELDHYGYDVNNNGYLDPNEYLHVTLNCNGAPADGASAFELAVENGFEGTLDEWLNSLAGTDGEDGADGTDGQDGSDGSDGADGSDGSDGSDGADGSDGSDGADGSDGEDGEDGAQGDTGESGSDGQDGADGEDGQDGTVPNISGNWINPVKLGDRGYRGRVSGTVLIDQRFTDVDSNGNYHLNVDLTINGQTVNVNIPLYNGQFNVRSVEFNGFWVDLYGVYDTYNNTPTAVSVVYMDTRNNPRAATYRYNKQ